MVILGVLMVITLLPLVNAAPTRVLTSESESVYISNAYYDDLDGDTYFDDIKILVEFAFTDSEPTRIDISLWVTLPSGTTYSFRVSVHKPPSSSTLQIDCIDMAYECGWYQIQMLASIVNRNDGKALISDVFSFDPPTGGGPGLPTVSAYF
ncbi:MAG: hypothetical protein ACTSYL_06295 [Candidatus Thorarchaeota archaeon]